MKRLSPFLLMLLLGAAVLSTGCGVIPGAAAAAPPADTPSGLPVQVATVETGDMSLVLNYAGKLQSQQDVTLLSRAAGQIKQVLVKEGDPVKTGTPLVIVEDDVYAAQLKQAKGMLAEAQLTLQKMDEGARPEQLAAAKSSLEIARAALADVKNIDDNERTTASLNLANAQAALRLAQAEYDKIAWAGQVGETAQALQLEQATNAYEASLAGYNLQTNPSEAQLASLQAQVVQADLALALAEKPFRPVDYDLVRAKLQQAEAVVELAQLQLDYTTIRAPFDGVVADLYVHPGSMVSTALPMPVAKVLSNQMEVVVNVEESRLNQVAVGQHVGLKVSAYPGQVFPAVVSSIAPAADDKTHTFKVKIIPQDKQNRLRSGMYADAAILLAEKKNAVLIPLSALTTMNGQPAVYVVNGDAVEGRPVTTGLSNKQQVEILSGLQPGDQVVVAGLSNLQDKAKVKVVPNL